MTVAVGFTGWLHFPEVRSSVAIPTSGGAYAVSYAARDPVAFLAASPDGRFKGKDPKVTQEVLAHSCRQRPPPIMLQTETCACSRRKRAVVVVWC